MASSTSTFENRGASCRNVDIENIELDEQMNQALEGSGSESNAGSEREIVMQSDVLKECNVEVFNESWLDYSRSRMSSEGMFKLILMEPFQKGAQHEQGFICDETIAKLANFCRKALAPDGFCFLILPWMYLSHWHKIFEGRELQLYSIFRLGFSRSCLPKVKGKIIRDPFQDALVFRPQTKRKVDINVQYPYHIVPDCSYSREFAIIDQIPPPQRLRFKGSKMQVRTTEKAPALYWELMRTFCPPGGRVLDVFAGPMCSGIACIKSFRPCVLLEKDKRCFELAVQRLQRFAEERLADNNPLDVDNFQDLDNLEVSNEGCLQPSSIETREAQHGNNSNKNGENNEREAEKNSEKGQEVSTEPVLFRNLQQKDVQRDGLQKDSAIAVSSLLSLNQNINDSRSQEQVTEPVDSPQINATEKENQLDAMENDTSTLPSTCMQVSRKAVRLPDSKNVQSEEFVDDPRKRRKVTVNMKSKTVLLPKEPSAQESRYPIRCRKAPRS